MAFNLTTFRRQVHSVGRNQYFIVRIPQVGNEDIVTAMARSTSLPAVTHGTTDIAYRGLNMKIDTQPEFSTWDVTFLCDEAHALRNVFLKWTELAYNVQTQQNLGHNDYKVDGISVSQLAADKQITSTCVFMGAWPTGVAEIGFDQAGGDVENFSVTFTYDYFVMNSLEGNVVLDDVDFAVGADGRFSGVSINGLASVALKV